MKSDKWIVEFDGYRFAVDRTFDGNPAVYAGDPTKDLLWQMEPIADLAIPEDGLEVVIVARVVAPQ